MYSSEKEDDFAPFRIQNKPLPENYRYSIKNPIGRAVSFFLYYFAALSDYEYVCYVKREGKE